MDEKRVGALTSWKIVSPCPALCSGGCCCCWARRCFCLADCRHIVIISVQASIFAMRRQSNCWQGGKGWSEVAVVVCGREADCRCDGHQVKEEQVGDSEMLLCNFEVRCWAELPAPPAPPAPLAPPAPPAWAAVIGSLICACNCIKVGTSSRPNAPQASVLCSNYGRQCIKPEVFNRGHFNCIVNYSLCRQKLQ